MEIRVGSLLAGAQAASGTAVIIDVFRAFTTAAIAFDRGAAEIVLVAEVEEALELRRQGIGDVLMGEVDGRRPDGFDFGNSPYEISQAEVAGKRLVQSTRAGTVGVAAASGAAEIYLGSFLVAQATAAAIARRRPAVVDIVAMGDQARVRSDEDEHCALYLRNIIEGRRPDFTAVQTLIRSGGATQKFFDPAQPQYHPEDVTLALQADRYNFTMPVTRENGLLVARRQPPAGA